LTCGPMNPISRYRRKRTRSVVGLMSGTSADGVDAALVRVSGTGETLRVHLEAFHTTPYQPRVREAVFRLFQPKAPVAEVCRMSFELGRLFAEAALGVIERAGLRREDVDLIASHGQTVCHLPASNASGPSEPRPFRTPNGSLRVPEGGDPSGSRRGGATLQIGEPSVIAELTGITVVADFRPRDMAAGGEGAPLTPYADWVLFRHPERSRAVQNIGGIANVTYLPRGGGLADVIAFDTGPGNMVVDGVVEHVTSGKMTFDRDGEMAARGRVDDVLLEWLMEHEFISKRPPKSTGREEFGAQFVRTVLERAEAMEVGAENLVATVTAFTAESIAQSYRQFLFPRAGLDEVILGGGGSYNSTLCEMVRARLAAKGGPLGAQVLRHEDFGINGEAKEAIAFAILGNETMLGRPANVPTATGAGRAVVLGKIVPA